MFGCFLLYTHLEKPRAPHEDARGLLLIRPSLLESVKEREFVRLGGRIFVIHKG